MAKEYQSRLIKPDTPCTIHYEMRGLDSKPYCYKITGEIISHKRGGWLKVKPTKKEVYQYRASFYKEGELFYINHITKTKITILINEK